MHSPMWSPTHSKTLPWHPVLEEWLNRESFVSMVLNGTITWCHPHHCGSLLDQFFLNTVALAIPSFPCTCAISFTYSFGSDHTGLSITIPLSCSDLLPTPQLVPWLINNLQ